MEKSKTILMRIVAAIEGMARGRTSGNDVLEDTWQEYLEVLAKNHLPKGGGIDNGTQVDLEDSTPTKLVFLLDYHHMNYLGVYTRWTTHKLQVRPAFNAKGFTVKVRGKSELNEHLRAILEQALVQEFPDEHHKDLIAACRDGR